MKVSIITGANRGIGLELAKQLVSLSERRGEGVVIACSRNVSEELDDLKKHKNLHHVYLDVTSQNSVNDAFSKISSLLEGKGVNLLINNAGVLLSREKPSLTKPDDFMKTFDVNVVGAHRVTQAFAPLLELASEQNQDVGVGCNKALCLNISSTLGSIMNTKEIMTTSYNVSKAALNMLTRVTSIELLQKGVLCCSVHPGWVQTDMGGPNAAITTKTSVDGLMHVIEHVNEEHSGVMLGCNMNTIPF